jgi:hypothetical protein
VTAPAPPEQDSSIAALIERAARGKRLTDPERDALRRALIRMKKNGNVSYGAIGSVYGLSGREMKQVRRVAMAARAGSRDAFS